MGKRDELIAFYAEELKTGCGIDPDMDLLTKVTIGCGPAIYDPDRSCIDATDPEELDMIRRNFLVKKLGLPEGPALMDAIGALIDAYGRADQEKYRVVMYYMLTKHFRREAVFG